MKVYKTKSSSGNNVPNQFIIEDGNKTYFQSYKSIIAVSEHINYDIGTITTLDEKCLDYSRTTSKYLSLFLGEDTKTIKAKIKSGEYKLADLNK